MANNGLSGSDRAGESTAVIVLSLVETMGSPRCSPATTLSQPPNRHCWSRRILATIDWMHQRMNGI